STFTGPITIHADVQLVGSATDRTVFAGRITGTGNVFIRQVELSNRRVVLDNAAGDNDFVGSVTVGTDTVLQVGLRTTAGQIPDASDVHFANAGSTLNLHQTSEVVGGIDSDAAGAGVIGSDTGTSTLTVDTAAGSSTFSGSVVDGGGTLTLVKRG